MTRQHVPLTYAADTINGSDGTPLLRFEPGTLTPFERDLLAEFIVEAVNTYAETRDELTTVRRELINTKLAMRSLKLPPKGR